MNRPSSPGAGVVGKNPLITKLMPFPPFIKPLTNSINSTRRQASKSSKPRVGILDLLRFLAITFVVITHYQYQLLPGGSVGVSIFFCLSGYLITKNLLDKQVSISNFLVRRMFRIYPAFLVVCLLHLFILYYTRSAGYKEYLVALPKFLMIIKMPDVWLGFGVGVFWTLQVELWFYLLIPFLIKKTGAHTRLCAIVSLIILSYLFKSLVIFDVVRLSTYSILRTLYWMDNLLYGCLAALALEEADISRLKIKEYSSRFSIGMHIFLLLVFAGIFCVARLLPSVGSQWPLESSLVSFLTAAIIFYSQKYPFLNYKMPAFISFVSLLAYVIYLVHPFPLDYYIACRHFFNMSNFEYKALGFVMLSALVLLLHYLVEKTGIRLGKKLSCYLAA